MNNKVKIIIIILILLIILSVNAMGSTRNVNVTLPKFDVKINGIKIDNQTRDYPLIIYKDIMYFPMTFNDSRFLGLKTSWDVVEGLEINKSEKFEGYVDVNSTVNKERYTATVPGFSVKVNGKDINNNKEQYPLLLFRNITYFPLTWRFAVEEFGWKYNFTNDSGLNIISTEDNSIDEIIEVNLPIAERDSNLYTGAFTVAGNYFYYEGDNGVIYQAPISNPAQRKAVYNLPLWSYGDSYVSAGLKTVYYDKVILTYHQGGAVMGTDYEIILYEDGTNKIYDSGYSNKVGEDDYTSVRVDQWAPPFKNNLTIKLGNDQEYKSIGDPDLLYGWVKQGDGKSDSNDLVLAGDTIYILATYKPEEENTTTGIYKINIPTGETVRLCEESAKKFIMNYDIIYFMDMEGYIYQYNKYKEDYKTERLTDFKVSDFTVLNNQVYYISDQSNGYELYKLGDTTSVNPGGRIKNIVNDNGYVCFIFEKDSNAAFKMMVFDNNGKAVFKTSQNIRYASINNFKVFYMK